MKGIILAGGSGKIAKVEIVRRFNGKDYIPHWFASLEDRKVIEI